MTVLLEANQNQVASKQYPDVGYLHNYAELLDWLGKTKSQLAFRNDNKADALTAIQKLMEYSDREFFLYDQSLEGDVAFQNADRTFRRSSLEFISRGGHIKLVIKSKFNENAVLSNELRVLRAVFPNNFEIKKASEAFNSAVDKFVGEKANFAIGDNNKYRIETNTGLVSNEAYSCFNDKEKVKKIKKEVIAHYSSCHDYFDKT